MLNKNVIIKRLTKISRRMETIAEKSELEEMKVYAMYIVKLIKVDLGLGYLTSLKIKNLESEKVREICDEMLNRLEYMETLPEKNNKLILKIQECIKMVEFIKIEC